MPWQLSSGCFQREITDTQNLRWSIKAVGEERIYRSVFGWKPAAKFRIWSFSLLMAVYAKMEVSTTLMLQLIQFTSPKRSLAVHQNCIFYFQQVMKCSFCHLPATESNCCCLLIVSCSVCSWLFFFNCTFFMLPPHPFLWIESPPHTSFTHLSVLSSLSLRSSQLSVQESERRWSSARIKLL